MADNDVLHDGDHQKRVIKRLATSLLEQSERNTRKAEVDAKGNEASANTVYFVYERNAQSGWQSAAIVAGPGAGEIVVNVRPERSVRTALYWELANWFGKQPRVSWEDARSRGARCVLIQTN